VQLVLHSEVGKHMMNVENHVSLLIERK